MESPDGIYHGISIATVDETLWQMSDMLARAQLARQNSRNTPLRWQQQSRIHKSTSTGNSPQTLSRRRNAAYQQKLTYHAEANPVPSRSSFISSQHVHPRQSRPVTWHTSSHSISNTYLPAPCTIMNPYENRTYQQSTLTTAPPPSVTIAQPTSTKRQRYHSVPRHLHATNEYQHVPISNDWATNPSEQPSPYQAGYAQALSDLNHDVLLPMHAPFHQQQAASLSAPFEEQHARNYVPVDTSHMRLTKIFESGQKAKQLDGGPVLVAMGLYDPPEAPRGLSGIFTSTSGRGLKLEDAWTPPEDDDEKSDDAEDHDYDDEDQESEQQEDDIDAEMDGTTYPSIYGAGNLLPLDMNNKSFLFEDSTPALQVQDLSVGNWHAGRLVSP